jgi:cell division protein ZapA
MASVDVEIASRSYSVACRDGEEAHLRALASIVDRKARDAATAVGSMGEARQLLFASLLLADELKEVRAGGSGAPVAEPEGDTLIAEALERLAERMEMLAERLEGGTRNA